jgi:succinate-semialdehyde dehydrogenase/glutarate-semialdehyde dehydrogenase
MATDVQIGFRHVIARNPATGETLCEFECVAAPEISAAVQRARAAQPAWAEKGLRHRIHILRQFQRLLHEKRDDVACAITQENGKPQVEALVTEILVVLDAARFLIENAHAELKPEPVPHGSLPMKMKSACLVREPYGVIGIISPWNYPFATPATESLAALVAGNAVVLKPSEFTPLSALGLAALLHQAGVPEDAFQVVIGDGVTGAALVEAPIDKIIFTGSVRSGKRVADLAAKKLLPTVLELGGKDPMLVLDDANVDVASSAALWGAFMNAGQTCLSVERCYVHRSLYQKFLQAIVDKTRKLRVGNGLDPETEIGPIIHEQQLRVVEAHVADAVTGGARLLSGGKRLSELGPNFYTPTVLADVTHEMLIMREETFGPVLPIMAFDSDGEAVRLANDSEFGLAASVWTSDRRRGEALARRIEAGTVMVNDVISCFGISEAPHGGVKSSGLGRAHGRLGLEEMVRIKYVDSDLLPRVSKVWWFGYGREFTRQMNGFVDLLFASNLRRRIAGAVHSVAAYFRKGRL